PGRSGCPSRRVRRLGRPRTSAWPADRLPRVRTTTAGQSSSGFEGTGDEGKASTGNAFGVGSAVMGRLGVVRRAWVRGRCRTPAVRNSPGARGDLVPTAG